MGDLYQIHFECQNNTGSSFDAGIFSLSGQIGHCHIFNPCTSYDTFADETTRSIPKPLGIAPTNITWEPPFANNESLDLLASDSGNEFRTSNASATRVCNQYNPYHGSCYWYVTPTSNSTYAGLYFDYYDDDFLFPGLGSTPLHHEFVVRCPVGNSDPCRLRLVIEGRNDGGTLTGSVIGDWITIPDDGTWYVLYMATSVLAPATRWRFFVQAFSGGDYFDADFNAQYYDV